MKHFYFYISLPFVLFFTACSSMQFVDIEVQKPGEMTFAPEIVNIGFLNNANAVDSDSSNSVMILALSQFVDEYNFFDEVRPLDAANVDGLISSGYIDESSDIDALVVLDSYNLHAQIDSSMVTLGYTTLRKDSFSLFTNADLSVIGKRGDQLYPPITLNDTLIWTQMRMLDGEFITPPIPVASEMLLEAALSAATKLEKKLVPYWEEQVRWYYTDGSTQMKYASAAAKKNEWDAALTIWNKLYEKEKSDVKKAKLASNIALALEMSDNIQEAVEWISIAEELFPASSQAASYNDGYISDKVRAHAYKKELRQRIADNEKLNIQVY